MAHAAGAVKTKAKEQLARNQIRSFSTDTGRSRHFPAVGVRIDDDKDGLLSFGLAGFRLFKNVDLCLPGEKRLRKISALGWYRSE